MAIVSSLRYCLLPALIAAWAGQATAALNDPFPMGHDMATFGAILTGDQETGAQPWTPACFVPDSGRWGFGLAAVDYYDDMGNFSERDIRQLAVGGWMRLGRSVAAKCSYAHFNALKVYFEQKAELSVAITALPHARFSAQLAGLRAGVVLSDEEREALAMLGVSLWIPWSFASLSLACENITIEDASQPGFAPPLRLCLGVHTREHRLGAQGARVVVDPASGPRIRFLLGETLSLHRQFRLNVGLATNPVMLGFGVTVDLPTFAASAAVVQHPVLGWSKGFGMGFQR